MFSKNENKYKLQLLQIAAGKIVESVGKTGRLSVSSIRENISHLPISARIEFKIIVLAWKAYHVLGPKYLIELLVKHKLHNIRIN